MSFSKFLPFLALGLLIMYQVGLLQAAPARPALENSSHPTSLTEEEKDLLLAILVKEFLKKMASEKARMINNSSTITQKRACNTGTCLTNKLAGLLSRSGSVAKTNLLPPDMVTNDSGRRGRDLDA